MYREICHYLMNGFSDSGVLFIMVLFDTMLAVAYRVKKHKAINSSTLISGMLRNTSYALMPLLLQALQILVHDDSYILYNIFKFGFTVIGFLALSQSCIANLKLNGAKIDKWLPKIYDLFLKDEVEKKLNK